MYVEWEAPADSPLGGAGASVDSRTRRRRTGDRLPDHAGRAARLVASAGRAGAHRICRRPAGARALAASSRRARSDGAADGRSGPAADLRAACSTVPTANPWADQHTQWPGGREPGRPDLRPVAGAVRPDARQLGRHARARAGAAGRAARPGRTGRARHPLRRAVRARSSPPTPVPNRWPRSSRSR